MRMLGLYPESNVLWEEPSHHPLGDSDASLETTALQYPTPLQRFRQAKVLL